jgi:hypothetical protein
MLPTPPAPETYPNVVRSTIDIDLPTGSCNDQFRAPAEVALTGPRGYARRRGTPTDAGDHAPHLRNIVLRNTAEAIMTTFDKRQEGFEQKFAHDEQLRFKANARRNKMLGQWAAGKLGLSGTSADDYAKDVIVADLEEAGDDGVFRKIRRDFDAKGVAQSDHQLRRTMDELMEKAIAQVKQLG